MYSQDNFALDGATAANSHADLVPMFVTYAATTDASTYSYDTEDTDVVTPAAGCR